MNTSSEFQPDQLITPLNTNDFPQRDFAGDSFIISTTTEKQKRARKPWVYKYQYDKAISDKQRYQMYAAIFAAISILEFLILSI